jgi:hypothetical protein
VRTARGIEPVTGGRELLEGDADKRLHGAAFLLREAVGGHPRGVDEVADIVEIVDDAEKLARGVRVGGVGGRVRRWRCAVPLQKPVGEAKTSLR